MSSAFVTGLKRDPSNYITEEEVECFVKCKMVMILVLLESMIVTVLVSCIELSDE
jgi:hypothetical protein